MWLPAVALSPDAAPSEAWNEKCLLRPVWRSADRIQSNLIFIQTRRHSLKTIWLQRLERHPQHKQEEKKKGAYAMIASFTAAISLAACLPACPTYLCPNLSYQFLSHNPRLPVITHHPLIERKGPCSVNNLTNLYDLISLEHVSANILSHKWFIHLRVWCQNSHPCLRFRCTYHTAWVFI